LLLFLAFAPAKNHLAYIALDEPEVRHAIPKSLALFAPLLPATLRRYRRVTDGE
jgi:hypothetical protein